MNVTLFDDLILVRLLPMEKVSEGGIIIPETADNKNKKATGIVIEHGEGYMDLSTGIRQPITVTKNDKVSFTFGKGTPMDDFGDDVLLLRERDLDFIIDDFDEKFTNLGIFVAQDFLMKDKEYKEEQYLHKTLPITKTTIG